MIIQWYPGHMNKALAMMEKEIKLVDALIYVLDARAPFSCINPKFTKLVGDKPIIYVLNKCDMANDDVTTEWYNYFSKKGSACIVTNSSQTGSNKKIISALRTILNEKIQRYALKSITPTIRAMVIGVPNSGKSTLINNMCGKAKTVTGNRPGVTRGKQWVNIDNGMELLDTPGTLWPAFNNNLVAQHLAYIGSIKEEVLDIPTLCLEFIKEVLAINSKCFEIRYNIIINESDTPLKVLEKICVTRGYVLKGGVPDYDRTAQMIITDFKQGRLEKLTLEKVKDINALLVNDRMEEK